MRVSGSGTENGTVPTNLNPPGLPEPRGYSHATIAGDTIWLAGQTGCDAEGRIVSPTDIAAQFSAAIQNLRTVLKAAGCDPADVVKLTIYVTDVAAYRKALRPVGEAYREAFGRHFPATTLIEVKGLFDPAAMVEIECVAVRREC
jgi:enamine deaminase RidA (YjgF/YER057c/UK114 family)